MLHGVMQAGERGAEKGMDGGGHLGSAGRHGAQIERLRGGVQVELRQRAHRNCFFKDRDRTRVEDSVWRAAVALQQRLRRRVALRLRGRQRARRLRICSA